MSRELIEQYYAAWQPGNADSILAFFTEDAVFEDLAFEARFEGPDQIRAFIDLTYSGIPDFAVKPTHIVVGDGSAAAEWVMSGTHQGDLPGLPRTGQAFALRASSVITLSEERIAVMNDFWNPDAFRRLVGLL